MEAMVNFYSSMIRSKKWFSIVIVLLNDRMADCPILLGIVNIHELGNSFGRPALVWRDNRSFWTVLILDLTLVLPAKKIALLMICFKTKSHSIVHWGIYPLPNILSIWINYNDLTTTSLEQWEWHDVELLYYCVFRHRFSKPKTSKNDRWFSGKSTTGIVLYMFDCLYNDILT